MSRLRSRRLVNNFVALAGTFASHGYEDDVEDDPDRDVLRWPPLWINPDQALVDDGDVVEIPPYIDEVVPGPELVAVIGEPLWRASEEEAAAAVKGFTVGNDMSAHGEFPEFAVEGTPASNIVGHTVLPGFFPVQHDYVEVDPDDLGGRAMVAEVDGTVAVESSTDEIRWSIGEMLAHTSKLVHLREDDIVAMGDPGGSSELLDDASEVTCRIEGLGEVTNPIEHPD